MAKDEWSIPETLQPDQGGLGFDLGRALSAVVSLRSMVPEDAFTAPVLGTDREGSAVLIRDDGLFLTIGYLITEAESVWLRFNDGRVLPGAPLAIDQETGFGLVQALGRPHVPALPFGDSEALQVGAEAVLAGGGGRAHALACRLVARQPFAGYWEYLLEDALFTAPAHPAWGGAGLIGPDGALIGIGSLILQEGDEKRRKDLNMVVPIHRLRAVLDDLLTRGRPDRPVRPWLGLYATEDEEGVTVASLAPGGPAEKAGIRAGDRVVSVADAPVGDLATLWRAVWSVGVAGARVPMKLARRSAMRDITVVSSDRTRFLKAPRMH
ncbi:MAG TPA: S1C family serine protease [Roseomonas sp.]|jgi:S1-C subfamily serine protease